MGLRDEVLAAAIVRPGPKCSMARLQLDPDDAADLQRLLLDPFIPTAVIARALAARGVRIGAQTLGRHRKRECTCDDGQAAA